MKEHKAHISQFKKQEVVRIKNLIQKYKVIAIADMTSMPSYQLQKLRSNTKDSVFITMAKGRLIRIAFEDLKDKIKNIQEIEQYIKGMPALLLTNENPFKLAKLLRKSKSAAPAKPGQIAPNDIMVPAGPTPFPPGPIIGELGQVGIKASVQEGKVAVKEDTIVVKEGHVISSQVANILARLGIEPMEVGINLLAALENGEIFKKDVLDIDDSTYINNIKLAYLNAFNLAFNVAYPTGSNIKLLIKKAFLDSSALADSKKIMTSESVKKELAKANIEAEHLKSKFNLPDSPEEEVKEEIPIENGKKNLIDEEEAKRLEEERVAQSILRKLQDQKMAKEGGFKKEDIEFKHDEKKAQDVLKKLQDDKIKKEDKKHK